MIFAKRLLILVSVLFVLGCNDSQKNQRVVRPKSNAGAPAPGALGGGGGGTDIGGGGNAEEARWMAVASYLSENIRRLAVTEVETEEFSKIRKQFPILVKEAKIEFKDYPLKWGIETAEHDNPSNAKFLKAPDCLNLAENNDEGIERDAINFSSTNLIKVSRPHFRCIPDSSETAHRIVLHEYLGLMGITERDENGTHYEISNKIIAAFKTLSQYSDGYEVVLIKTCDEFLKFREPFNLDSHIENFRPRIIRFAQDIDCEGRNLTKLGEISTKFEAGHLDGNGYAIKNLTITSSPMDQAPDRYNDAALFGSICLKCSIKFLRLENIKIINGQSLLVARNSGLISHVAAQGEILGSHPTVGGLVGMNEDDGVIEYSSVKVKILQTEAYKNFSFYGSEPTELQLALQGKTGGLVGTNVRGLIFKSTAIAEIDRDGLVGGLVADQRNTGITNKSKAVLNIRARRNSYIGGLMGVNYGSTQNSVVEGIIRLDEDSLFVQSNTAEDWQPIGAFVGMNASSGFKPDDPHAVIANSHANLNICGIAQLHRWEFNEATKAAVEVTSAYSPSVVKPVGDWKEVFTDDSDYSLERYLQGSVVTGKALATCP